MEEFWYKVGDTVKTKDADLHLTVGKVVYVDTNGDCMLRFYPEDNPKMICNTPVIMAETSYGMGFLYELA